MNLQNRQAFLDTIAASELGADLLAKSDNGYNVIVGSTPKHPVLFHSYADHPRVLVKIANLGLKSTAAGRYQILARYFDIYKKQLGLPDFSPASQDKIALQLIKECHALEDIDAGHIEHALMLCASRWASLPSSGYGQRENTSADLKSYFVSAGGVVAV